MKQAVLIFSVLLFSLGACAPIQKQETPPQNPSLTQFNILGEEAVDLYRSISLREKRLAESIDDFQEMSESFCSTCISLFTLPIVRDETEKQLADVIRLEGVLSELVKMSDGQVEGLGSTYCPSDSSDMSPSVISSWEKVFTEIPDMPDSQQFKALSDLRRYLEAVEAVTAKCSESITSLNTMLKKRLVLVRSHKEQLEEVLASIDCRMSMKIDCVLEQLYKLSTAVSPSDLSTRPSSYNASILE